MTGWVERLKSWARALKRDVIALWIAAHDPHTPWIAKLIAGAVAAYALSPVDLIPDFVPVLGYVDDLLIVPLGMALAIRLVPPALMMEFRALAVERGERPRSYAAATMIVVAWLGSGAVVAYWLWRELR